MSQINCSDSYFTCENANLPTELVFRQMVVVDENGCPMLRTSSTASGGGGQTDTNLTQYRNTALSNTGVSIVSTAKKLRGWSFLNNTSAVVYVKVYDKATAATSSDTPIKTLSVPANGGFNIQDNTGFQQYNFTSGISIRCSTGLADSDNTAPSAGIYVELYYV